MAKDDKAKTETTSCAEAGRRGGEKTSATHGRSHYQRIGQKGGMAIRRLTKAGRDAEKAEQEDSSSGEN